MKVCTSYSEENAETIRGQRSNILELVEQVSRKSASDFIENFICTRKSKTIFLCTLSPVIAFWGIACELVPSDKLQLLYSIMGMRWLHCLIY